MINYKNELVLAQQRFLASNKTDLRLISKRVTRYGATYTMENSKVAVKLFARKNRPFLFIAKVKVEDLKIKDKNKVKTDIKTFDLREKSLDRILKRLAVETRVNSIYEGE